MGLLGNRPVDCLAEGQAHERRPFGNLARPLHREFPDLKDIPQLTPHGWRAMAVCDRRLAGLEHQEISAQLCMSLQMVMRYSKHIDGERLARLGNVKREQNARQDARWPPLPAGGGQRKGKVSHARRGQRLGRAAG
jgi:hypothetical protein